MLIRRCSDVMHVPAGSVEYCSARSTTLIRRCFDVMYLLALLRMVVLGALC